MIFNMVGGGGAGLNLKVVGGTTQPVAPVENTIWVNTDVTINSYAFSTDEPTNPVEGMVWFQTGLDAPAPINIDKKNTVMLYPTGCKQYISGAWVDKTAKTYINGAWVDWYVYLLKLGWQDAALGGWNIFGNYGSATFGSTGLVLTHQYESGKLLANKSILDVSNYSKLCFVVEITDYTSYAAGLHVGIASSNQWNASDFLAKQTINQAGTFTLEVDISSVNNGYIKINNEGTSSTISYIYLV